MIVKTKVKDLKPGDVIANEHGFDILISHITPFQGEGLGVVVQGSSVVSDAWKIMANRSHGPLKNIRYMNLEEYVNVRGNRNEGSND